MKTGTVSEDDYGNLRFKFDDGTTATAYWIPIGELGDGQGGIFEEDPEDSGLTPDQLSALADANTACGYSATIRQPS